MKDQKTGGIALSYLNILLGLVMNLVLTPLLITALSEGTYSLYRVMQSLAGPLTMLNLGLGTVAARCTAGARDETRENTLAMTLAAALVLAGLALTLGLGLGMLIPRLYGGNFTPEEITLAGKLFPILAASAAVNIVTDVFRGCAVGNGRFCLRYGSKTVYYLSKLAVTVLLLKLGFGALGAAWAELAVSCGQLALFALTLREKMHLHRWDHREFRTVLGFSAAVLLQAVVNQVNNNADLMILGALEPDKAVITMYSGALTIFSVYNSMLSVFSGVFFPRAVELVDRGAPGRELTDFVIGPGRIQGTIALGILGGFALFGREFMGLWLGEAYAGGWKIALALMIPMTIPLVQTLCLNILDARLDRLHRSAVLCAMAAGNVAVSLLLYGPLGHWGAVTGTVLSLVLGHGVLMNRYYRKKLRLEPGRMLKEIFRGNLPCALGAVLLCLPLRDLSGLFLIRCGLFCVIYGLLLWKFGWNEQEKQTIGKLWKRGGGIWKP